MLMLSMTACGDKGPEDPEKPDEVKGEMEQLTPTESKKFLEETAEEALNKFRAADQRDVIVLCSYFCDEYGYLDAPVEFEIEETETGSIPGRYMSSLAKALSTADASRAGSAAIVYTYSLDIEKFKGVYEPGASQWMRTADSNDIVFRFKDAAGKQCELKAVISSTNSEGQISYADEEYYYDYETDDYVEYETENVYKFRIPKEVTVTLTCGGSSLATAKVSSDLNVSGHKISVTANVNAANIAAAVKLEGADTQVTQSSSFSVSGEVIVNSSATVNGNHLCDSDFYKEIDEDNVDDKLIALLKNGTAAVSVLNKVRVDADVTYDRSVYKAFNGEWNSWSYDSKTAAETDAEAAADALNENVKAYVRYNNKETVQATLLWKYNFDEWGTNSWEYMLEPLIKFDADGTTYSFDEYFETGFASVEDLWDSLWKSYEKVWDSARQ